MRRPDTWSLVSYEVTAASGKPPTVRVTLRQGEQEHTAEVASGDGPLNALFVGIEELTGVSVTVRDFQVRSVTRGKDAQGESTVEVEHQGQLFRGHGVSTDSVEAGTLAFLNAVNRVASGAGRPAVSPAGEGV